MGKFLLSVLVALMAIILLAGFAMGQDVGGPKIGVSIANNGPDGVQLVSMPEVAIPEEAKATGLGGSVMVRVRVGQTGVVLDAEVTGGPRGVCPSANRADVSALRRAAEDAARGATFKPFVGEQQPQDKTVVVEFLFPQGRPEQGSSRMISGGVLNGKAVQLTKPEFPPAARAVRASGDVNVKVVIDTDGSVFSADASAGHPLLRRASEVAACDSRFTPTLLQGVPVKISGVITYNFVP
jgi:TonB family protein